MNDRLLQMFKDLVEAVQPACDFLEGHDHPKAEEIRFDLEIQLAACRRAVEMEEGE